MVDCGRLDVAGISGRGLSTIWCPSGQDGADSAMSVIGQGAAQRLCHIRSSTVSSITASGCGGRVLVAAVYASRINGPAALVASPNGATVMGVTASFGRLTSCRGRRRSVEISYPGGRRNARTETAVPCPASAVGRVTGCRSL